jgi:hypothetical protein
MMAGRETSSILDRIHVLRSKNAGPFTLTFDIVLDNEDDFAQVVRGLDREAVARAYAVPPEDVTSISSLARLNAVKICIRRRRPAGHPGDSDCYGMNQEEPLARLLRDMAG